MRRRGLPVVEVGPEPSALARRGDTTWLGGTAATTLPPLIAPRSMIKSLLLGSG
jgi:hypothetical protein